MAPKLFRAILDHRLDNIVHWLIFPSRRVTRCHLASSSVIQHCIRSSSSFLSSDIWHRSTSSGTPHHHSASPGITPTVTWREWLFSGVIRWHRYGGKKFPRATFYTECGGVYWKMGPIHIYIKRNRFTNGFTIVLESSMQSCMCANKPAE